MAVVVHTHLWWRSWRPRLPLYKQLFSTSTIALACLATGAVGALARPGDAGLLGPLGAVMIVLEAQYRGRVARASMACTAHREQARGGEREMRNKNWG